MGHADHEISAAFSRFDRDGNQILDEDEQERMKIELEEKRVCVIIFFFTCFLFSLKMKYICLTNADKYVFL